MNTQGISLEIREGVFKTFSDLVLDYSGTLSVDGRLLPGIKERLITLAQSIRITVLTADTFGKAKSQLEGLPVTICTVRTGADKADIARQMGMGQFIAIGNGRNDVPVMRQAGLRIVVIGLEGAASELLQESDILVTDICHALDLIINSMRLKATLRD